MFLDNGLNDRQAETGAAGVLGIIIIRTEKLIEQSRLVRLADADPRIFYGYQAFISGLTSSADSNFLVSITMAHCLALSASFPCLT